MTTWKPYIHEGKGYFEASKQKSFEDGSQGRNLPRSEFDKPYRGDSYQDYEWGWPGGWPPIDIEFPDWPWDPAISPGEPGPCNAPDGCGFIMIIGAPSELECGKEYTFKTAHSVYGCDLPTWGDAFVGWTVSKGEILSMGVIMRYRAPDCCTGEKVVITATGPYGCEDSVEIPLACCCREFSVLGSNTVNPGGNWIGTIDPPCPGATCNVTSNSGCILTCGINPSGDSVTVSIGASDCGSFTVTVTEEVSEGCTPQKQASKTVRINNTGQGGAWVEIESCTNTDLCPVGCRSGVGGNESCTVEQYQYQWSYNCCYTDLYAGAGCETDCPAEHCNPSNECGTPPCSYTSCGGSCNCMGEGGTVIQSLDKNEWKCSC